MSERMDRAAALELVNSVDNFMFDCEGVFWSGPEVIPGSIKTVDILRKMGKKVYFLTNNSSESRQGHIKKCLDNGLLVEENEMVCTSYVAALYLHNLNFKGKVYVIGEGGIGEEMDQLGIQYTGLGPDPVTGALSDWVEMSLDPDINCVVVGFDPHFSFHKILKAASYVKREGTIFIATNEDTRWAWEGAITIPGAGSMVSSVKLAAGKDPVVLGKPNKYMFTCLQHKFNLDPSRTVMVGDSVHTDIALANQCGLRSLLLLSGISNLEDVQKAVHSPDPLHRTYIPNHYLDKLGTLGDMLRDKTSK